MGELGLNKIMGALLATALGLMGLATLPSLVFGGEGGHHGDHEEPVTLSEKMCTQFHYCVEIAEAASTGEAEAVFDLGAALAAADLARGERTFAGQCSTCHTITPGGANGTGPNLHNIVGGPKMHIAGFNYSGAMKAAEGQWSYENLDAWLKSPAGYMKGTSMSFAGGCCSGIDEAPWSCPPAGLGAAGAPAPASCATVPAGWAYQPGSL